MKRWMEKYLNFKTLSLIILALQTSAMVLLLRYSRSAAVPYLVSTAVFFSELLKILISAMMIFIESGRTFSLMLAKILKECFTISGVFLILPAFLYVIQNNLLFVALTNLDAATYQVTYQLKILTTAIFSWAILGRRLSIPHWMALTLLMIGVSLVQVEEASISLEKGENVNSNNSQRNVVAGLPCHFTDGEETNCNYETSWLLGIYAVFVSCILSGFSGVYFEKILKSNLQTSLFIRNLQLASFSVLFSLVAIWGDQVAISKGGFFQGYLPSTWVVIFMQAFGGFVVSLAMKYADNILKGFATSLSIVMSSCVSWLWLGDKAPSLQFVFGASIVITATFMYGIAPLPRSAGTASSTDIQYTNEMLLDQKVETSRRRSIYSV